jgi:hypothetical protein
MKAPAPATWQPVTPVVKACTWNLISITFCRILVGAKIDRFKPPARYPIRKACRWRAFQRRRDQDRQKPSSARPTQLNTNTHEAITVSDAKVTMVWTDGIIELHCRQHRYFWRSTFVQTRRKLVSIDIESECGCVATAWKERPQKSTFASPSEPRGESRVWSVCRLMTPKRVWSHRLCWVCLRSSP